MVASSHHPLKILLHSSSLLAIALEVLRILVAPQDGHSFSFLEAMP
jgi:hypothetical protein